MEEMTDHLINGIVAGLTRYLVEEIFKNPDTEEKSKKPKRNKKRVKNK